VSYRREISIDGGESRGESRAQQQWRRSTALSSRCGSVVLTGTVFSLHHHHHHHHHHKVK